MADARITITIDADGTTAAQSIDLVTGALRQANEAAQHQEEGFSNLQASLITLREGYALLQEIAAKVKETFLDSTLALAEHVVELGHTAEALNISVQTLNQLNQASYLVTGSTDLLSTVMLRLERALGMAAGGTGPAAKGIQELGLNIQDLLALPANQQLETIVTALSHVHDPADKARIAMEIFNRAWMEVIPLMKDGGKALDEASQFAANFGLKLGDPVVLQMNALVQSTRELKVMWDTMFGDRSWWMGVVSGFENIAGSVIAAVTELRILATEGPAAAAHYADMINATFDANRAAASPVEGMGDAGDTRAFGGVAELHRQATEAAQALRDMVPAAMAYALSQKALEDAIMAKPGFEGMEFAGPGKASSGSAKELMAMMPGGMKKLLGAFGMDTEAMGASLDGVAGNLSGMTGMGISGAGLGGAIGVGLALLMQNPLFQADMKRLMEMVQQLITPLVEAIGPSLDALAPVMEELKPVFQVIGEELRIYLAPLVLELHAVAWALKPVSDGLTSVSHFLDTLAKDIENFNPFSGGGGSGGNGSSSGISFDNNGPHLNVGGTKIFDDGGLIRPQDMLGYNPSTGHGLIVAKAGESVNRQGGAGGGGHTFTFNITALDPKTIAESIRRMLEEQRALGRLGVN